LQVAVSVARRVAVRESRRFGISVLAW